jgi:endoglucanase
VCAGCGAGRWGGNLFGAERFPVATGVRSLDDRVVYSPHIYGPDVWMMNYFKVAEFPDNLDGW